MQKALIVKKNKEGFEINIGDIESLPDPFEVPPDHVKIWRYMDFAKFINMLHKEGLFFVRADKFEDPFEGSATKADIQFRERLIDYFAKNMKINREDAKLIVENEASTRYDNRNWFRICSWHMNNNESAAMWKIYSEIGKGICIQSTYKKLKRSLPHTIHIGVVKYIDHLSDNNLQGIITGSNLYLPYLLKQNWFEYEHELRAIFLELPPDQNKELIAKPIKVDLEKLIEKVYIYPGAEIWLSEIVNDVIKRFGLSIPVLKSSIDERPIF